jgi:hypothetical protein
MMMRRTFRRALLWALALVATAAHAQVSPSPSEINDCTRLTDPRRLQECIQRNTGVEYRLVPDQNGSRQRGPFLEDKGAAESGNPGPPP